MTDNKGFRIDNINIEGFYAREYPRFSYSPEGKSLFVSGTNNSGKTTTLAGILYSIFGYKFIDRSSSKRDDAEIVLQNENKTLTISREYNTKDELRLEEREEKSVFKGREEVENRLIEFLGLPSHMNKAKTVVSSLILPQRSEDAPLRSFSGDELDFAILSFSGGIDISEKIDQIEENIENKNQEIETLKYQKENILEDINDWESSIDLNKRYLNQLEEFLSVYDSGKIFEIQEALEKREELGEKIHSLNSEITGLRNSLSSVVKRIRDLHRYYKKEVLGSAKKTLSVLTCPVCGDNLDVNKVKTRKSRSKCPFCGKDEYSNEIFEKIKNRIDEANSKVEELRRKEERLRGEIDEKEKRIGKLKSEKESLSDANPVVLRSIKETENREEFEDYYERKKEKFENLRSKINDAKTKIEDNKEYLNGINSQIDKLENEIEGLEEDKKEIEKKRTEKNISKFEEILNSIYSELIEPLDHELKYKNGKIYLGTGYSEKDCTDKHALGFSQRKIIDVALWLTFHKLNLENNVTNLNFGLIDDIYENIDNNEVKWKDNLIDLIDSFKRDVQFITFSINPELNSELEFECEEKLRYQTELAKFEESE